MLIYLIQSRIQMNSSVFENSLMAGIGVAIYKSDFHEEIAFYGVSHNNVKIGKSNSFERFGLNKFYKPNLENENIYFSI